MCLFIVGFYSGLHRSEVGTTDISRPICEMWCLHIDFYCFHKYITRHVPVLKVSFKDTQTYQHRGCRKQFSFVKTRILRCFITAGFGSVASHEVKSSPASMSFNKERTFVHSSVQPTTSLLRTYINATVTLSLNSVFVYEINSCNPRGPLSNMIGYTLRYRVSIPGRDRHFRFRY
jgi:hypothetical protein